MKTMLKMMIICLDLITLQTSFFGEYNMSYTYLYLQVQYLMFNIYDVFCNRALKPPGWKEQWHCGVRVASNKKLVGFISAIPAHVRIYNK